MSLTVQVDFATLIQVLRGDTGSVYSDLGYSLNGANVQEMKKVLPVYSDENGGEAGDPIDFQILSESHRINLLLTRYDPAVLDAIRASLCDGTPGVPPTPGSLVFQNNKSWKMKLTCTNRPRTYGRVVFFQEPIELNKGTKHSQALVVGMAYKDANGNVYT